MKKSVQWSAAVAAIALGTSMVSADSVVINSENSQFLGTSPLGYVYNSGPVSLGGSTYFVASDDAADATTVYDTLTAALVADHGNESRAGSSAYQTLTADDITYLVLAYQDYGGVTAAVPSQNNEIGEIDTYTDVNSPDSTSLNDIQFQLDLNQTAPTPGGTGTSTSDITGTVSATGSNEGNFNVQVDFTDPNILISGVMYSVVSTSTSGANAGLPATDIINIDIASLPKTAWTGVLLLGGVGTFSMLRRRITLA